MLGGARTLVPGNVSSLQDVLVALLRKKPAAALQHVALQWGGVLFIWCGLIGVN